MRLNYKIFGEGTPVVILHGLLGSLDNWQSFARRLSSQFKVFTVDLRNHGKSPHSGEHTYEAMAGDLAEFFAEHHIHKAHVIGHSMGGKVAMLFAINHPQKIDRLIVVDIAPRTYERNHDEIFEALLALDIGQVGKREDAEALLEPNIQDAGVRQFLLKNLDRNHDGSFSWKMNLHGLWENYGHINTAIESESPVMVPVTVIRGGRSSYVNESDLVALRSIFPEAHLVTIPEAGHWVHAEAPDDFYNIVTEALQG